MTTAHRLRRSGAEVMQRITVPMIGGMISSTLLTLVVIPAIGAAATDSLDSIVYNATNGALFYDADGSGAGAAVQFAALTPGLALTRNDFNVVA